MSTIKKIEYHAAEVAAKIKSGEKVSKMEMDVLKIFNSMTSGKAGNAGKRKVKKTGK